MTEREGEPRTIPGWAIIKRLRELEKAPAVNEDCYCGLCIEPGVCPLVPQGRCRDD